MDRFQPFGRGFCYVEYVDPDGAENAMKHMDGGQIDGQEITASPVLVPKTRPPPRRPSPIMRNNRPMPRWRASPMRYRRRPSIRRSPRRRRSRSPIRRRRQSNSSDSSR
uniref:RRM domain-containing protein n=2 Tax=Cellia TaxID=44534 RepID=A0A182PB28_9DIPT